MLERVPLLKKLWQTKTIFDEVIIPLKNIHEVK